jgi:hypothetical protein
MLSAAHTAQDRVRVEAEVLAEEGRHAPEHVPAMLDYDDQMFTIAMAYIAPPVSQLPCCDAGVPPGGGGMASTCFKLYTSMKVWLTYAFA